MPRFSPLSLGFTALGLLAAAVLPGCAVDTAPAHTAAAERPPVTAWFNSAASPVVEVQKPLLVRPRINGVDVGWFFVDTGATGMVISPDAARAAGLARIGRVSVVGARRFEAPSFRSERFELGPLHLHNVEFAGVDVGFISPGPGAKVAGIVGADLFRASVVEIDMASGAIRLFDPASYTLGSGHWTPLSQVPAGVAVDCRYGEGREGRFIIDTGGDFGIAFDLAKPDAVKLVHERPTWPQMLRGVGGLERGRAGELDWIELGGARLGPVGSRFFSAGRLTGAGEGVQGLIGSQVLREFLLVLDWNGSRAAFLPHPSPRPRD